MLHAIVTSDWHLGSLKSLFPLDHIHRQIRDLDRIYQYAISKGIEHVFVPGDVSDTPFMDYEVHVELLTLLLRYDNHVTTYYMAGNHDFSNKGKTSMDFLKTIHDNKFFKRFKLFLTPEQFEVDDVLVNMLPFPSTESLPSNKRPALNFVHTEFVGAIGDNGRELRTKHKFKRSKKDFTISGHIHQYQKLNKQKVIYCGNPYQKNFGESLPKGFIEIKAEEVKGAMEVKHKFVNNKPGYILQQYDINSIEDFSSLLDPSATSVRYKLFVNDDVYVPEDLRVRYPNIHSIFSAHLSTNKKELLVSELEESNYTGVKTVSLTDGLVPILKSEGLSKKERRLASTLVSSAMSELGLVALN